MNSEFSINSPDPCSASDANLCDQSATTRVSLRDARLIVSILENENTLPNDALIDAVSRHARLILDKGKDGDWKS